MKTSYTIVLSALALGASAALTTAQDAPRDPGRRPQSPVMTALDANKDGVIDAKEIENAPMALKALDKNNDGKLTGEEIRPAPGDRPAGADRPRGDRPGADRPRGDRPAGADKPAADKPAADKKP
ncbi:MAG: EF-hand domain-containing protein [Verrucomicrobiota bacterium]|nr:EF-hand domain-containing protein [Verrucomicrobiota bacterium]